MGGETELAYLRIKLLEFCSLTLATTGLYEELGYIYVTHINVCNICKRVVWVTVRVCLSSMAS